MPLPQIRTAIAAGLAPLPPRLVQGQQLQPVQCQRLASWHLSSSVWCRPMQCASAQRSLMQRRLLESLWLCMSSSSATARTGRGLVRAVLCTPGLLLCEAS